MKALVIGLVFLVCSCMPGQGASSLRTSGSATAKAVVLQMQDVPALHKCPQSDKWAGLMLTGQPEMLPTGMASWSDLRAVGATEGWLSLFAEDVPECPLLLSNTSPKGRLVYSAAIKFKDASHAIADYASDSQGFPVAADFFARFTAVGGKLTTGPSTGLGDHSVMATITLRGIPTYVVFWQKKNFEAVVYASNVSDSEGGSAATRMNDRIN
jgi:hypothetical protein